MKEKLKQVIKVLNSFKENYLKQKGYTNEAFFKDGVMVETEQFNLKEKKKYFNIDEGTVGVFMVNKENGLIFRIKAYGVIHKAKILGDINKIDIKQLWLKRWW